MLTALVLLLTAVAVNRLIAAVAAAIAGMLDLVYAIADLARTLIAFSLRVRRLLLRSIFSPIFGAPRRPGPS